ncbi:Protein doublesex like [Actinidia chinensis var. chinensis]|uniref:Protein doublesex like n=1 Tax=Actinidia chinensis var. chinensis TaxID=1590841 RepID=A0A2R6PLS6_ACTCC|nr:Protein doublesex like [Actinidia chinensis var. chinensis]
MRASSGVEVVAILIVMVVSARVVAAARESPCYNCTESEKETHVNFVWPYVARKFAALNYVGKSNKQIEGGGRIVPHNFKTEVSVDHYSMIINEIYGNLYI